MGSALERFRALARSDNSDNRCQKPPEAGAGDLLAPNAPIVGRVGLRDEIEERAAIIEYDAAVPRPWALAYALLLTAKRPEWLSADQWQSHLNAAGSLLGSWAAQMDRLGIHPVEVLGIDGQCPERPWEPSCLLPALVGVTVGAVSRECISIVFQDGGSRCLERTNGKWVFA